MLRGDDIWHFSSVLTLVVLCALKNPNFRQKSNEDEKIKADLRAKATQHIKDKNSLRRQLWEERKKVKSIMNPSLSKAKKRELVKEMLQPYMTETRIKCYMRGNWERVKNWTREDIILGITLRTISRKGTVHNLSLHPILNLT